MDWLRGGLGLAALLSVAGGDTGNTSAASVTDESVRERCTAGDVQYVARRNFDLFTIAFTDSGTPEQNARADHIAEDCQFRLYDDNDPEESPNSPEIPHVFSEEDYFLGGIAAWYTYAELSEFGLTPREAIEDMKLATDEVWWGPTTASDSQLIRIDVSATPYRDAVLGDEALIGNHRYVLFKAGTLAPGEYQWRWERTYQGETFVFRGHVTISSAP